MEPERTSYHRLSYYTTTMRLICLCEPQSFAVRTTCGPGISSGCETVQTHWTLHIRQNITSEHRNHHNSAFIIKVHTVANVQCGAVNRGSYSFCCYKSLSARRDMQSPVIWITSAITGDLRATMATFSAFGCAGCNCPTCRTQWHLHIYVEE